MNGIRIEGVAPHGRMVVEPTCGYGAPEYERDLMTMLGQDDALAKQAARRVLAFKLEVDASVIPDEAVAAAVLETRARGAEFYGTTIRHGTSLADVVRGFEQPIVCAPRRSERIGTRAQQDCEKKVAKNRARNKAARKARRKAR